MDEVSKCWWKSAWMSLKSVFLVQKMDDYRNTRRTLNLAHRMDPVCWIYLRRKGRNFLFFVQIFFCKFWIHICNQRLQISQERSWTYPRDGSIYLRGLFFFTFIPENPNITLRGPFRGQDLVSCEILCFSKF